jgi:hypothetical protein
MQSFQLGTANFYITCMALFIAIVVERYFEIPHPH